MGHTRQQYEDRIRARLGDLNVLQYLPEVQIPLALEDAITSFSKDMPRARSTTYSGDGTARAFDLTDATSWASGWSIVTSVEYPVGSYPPVVVDATKWIVDDEADEIILFDVPDAGTDNIRVFYLASWPFPTDDPDDDFIPDVYFPAVCAKAAATMARNKAGEMARRQSTSVAGDLYQADPTPLFEAARLLEKAYTDVVLGRPESEGLAPVAAMVTTDLDVFPASIFHRRADYIGDEEFGG